MLSLSLVLKATDQILPICSFKVWRHSPVFTSQILTVLSSLPLAKVLPSGLKATEVTQSVCSVKLRRHSPVSTSQSFTVLSSLALAKVLPSGLKATELIQSSLCPFKGLRLSPSLTCHKEILPLASPDAKRVPSGLNATE